MTAAPSLAELGGVFIQRDWLSANHVVFSSTAGAPATVVDTGYQRHHPLTIALVDHALGSERLARIVNTHLHSDHCGGNHAFQQRDPGLEILVPAPSFDAALHWLPEQLSYQATGQHCPRFHPTGALTDGQTITLGHREWEVHAAPGHDPQALMLFEPETRTLIAGDALWEHRLAVIFPAIAADEGFDTVSQTLDLIERLAPKVVLPGHGAWFSDVDRALEASRRRLEEFSRVPHRHLHHAARALLMYHVLELASASIDDLLTWLVQTPLFQQMADRSGRGGEVQSWAHALVDEMLSDGLLIQRGTLILPGQRAR